MQSIALPSAASTTVVTPVLDTTGGQAVPYTNMAIAPPNTEVVLKVPALNATMAPDTRTFTSTIEASDDSAFGSGIQTLRTSVQTGAGGAGAAATELRAVLPPDCPRYVRGKVVSGASTTDASTLTANIAFIDSGNGSGLN